MINYTLNNHIEKINKLKFLDNILTDKKEEEIFYAINELANFLEEEKINIDLFKELLCSVVETIEFCNNDKYNKNQFIEMIYTIKKYINISILNLNKKYPINIYFAGQDKYNLLQKVCNYKIINYENNKNKIDYSNCFNILILSEETYKKEIGTNIDKIIYYDKLMNDLFSLMEKLYYYNYDFYFLKNTLNYNKNKKLNKIIVGLSYSRHGIHEQNLGIDTKNLSLSSQDIYYSYLVAKKMIENNKNIRYCFIGLSKYSLHFDLSKSKNERKRIDNIYYKLFKDGHNYENPLGDKESLKDYSDILLKNIFDLDKLEDKLGELIFRLNNEAYFNKNHKRISNILGNYKYAEMSNNEKINLAQKRVEFHNSFVKYNETKLENIIILRKFIDLLLKNNIKPVILTFPVTMNYYNRFNKELIRQFDEEIIKFSKQVIYMDLFQESENFEENDFIDFDHLSESGAIKVTNIIKTRLKQVY